VPDAIVEKLNADIRKVVNTPEFRKGLEDQGMSAGGQHRATRPGLRRQRKAALGQRDHRRQDHGQLKPTEAAAARLWGPLRLSLLIS
jgi:hypothetical protein